MCKVILCGKVFEFSDYNNKAKAIKVYKNIEVRYCYDIEAVKEIFKCSRIEFKIIGEKND